ncbi:hypothetical protein SH501x_004375 [Pirellulaceae bacterium SH501]
MVRQTANNRSNVLAFPASNASVARLPWVGAIVVFLIGVSQPHVLLASCGDYLQHREGRIPHFASTNQTLPGGESKTSEPSCRSGQCRSKSPAPVVPSDFLTKLARLRDSFDSVSLRWDWSELGKAGVVRPLPSFLPLGPALEVPVPPPRCSLFA